MIAEARPATQTVEAPIDPTFQSWARSGLVWLPEHGMGFYPTPDASDIYDADYFQKYRGYAMTSLGRELTRLRVELVNAYTGGDVVDVGIGCGQFVETRGNFTFGYDVNRVAIHWLQARLRWRDPYAAPVEAISLWDVLEHIKNPTPLLTNVRRWVFCSLPIFTGPYDVLGSKHFRRDEHCWYWTSGGLVRWMDAHGFAVRHVGDAETVAGRQGIATFVFERVRGLSSPGGASP